MLMVLWGVIAQQIRWMRSYPTLLLQGRELTEDWETWRLELVKRSEEPDMRVRGHGRMRLIRNEEVLVLKARCSEEASATPSSVSLDGLTNILKSIPVKSCCATSRGGVVVKFLCGKPKLRPKLWWDHQLTLWKLLCLSLRRCCQK